MPGGTMIEDPAVIGDKPTIVSLYDRTGNWVFPYFKAGYNVILHDLEGIDQRDMIEEFPNGRADGLNIRGVLAAPPCTAFAGCGARHWPQHDAPGSQECDCCESFTDHMVLLVELALFFIDLFKPDWWALEQPIGRIYKLVPELGKPAMYFNPCDYGDPYTKKTALYGSFNTNLPKTPVLPLYGSMMWSRYGGKSKKTKQARSVTPMGFANAFFKANP